MGACSRATTIPAVSVLADLLADRAPLPEDAVDHLQLLLADWKILADLSFADLLLFVPTTLDDGTPGYLCVGQMRPYTAQTIYEEDLVGQDFPVTARPMVSRALNEQRVIRDADPDWSTGVPVREEAIPVRIHPDGAVVGVITREANVATARSPSQLELTYLQTAAELAQMVADGTFPYVGEEVVQRELSPRVGDGIVRVDGDGIVRYASPNAISAYRRLGTRQNVVGRSISDIDPGDGDLAEALATGQPLEGEAEGRGAVVVRRLLPLLEDGKVRSGLLLVREITELRRHERALRVKDATIREIHHRVKNNLQTVASLLRLQARRLHSDEARDALAESVRRISSIALVHETLSQDSRQRVSFTRITNRIVAMLADGLVDPDDPVRIEIEGQPGELPAEIATPLALVLTELLQNCVQHAFPSGFVPPGDDGAVVVVQFERSPDFLRVQIRDNGVGLPDIEEMERDDSLGLQIARTLVQAELDGTFEMVGADGGTVVTLGIPLA
jgi:two-component system, sensor histidine kinase PdtaS